MNQTEVITAIKEEAKSNKAADAVFHMWATRARARGQVTIAALDQRMQREGFTFDKAEYAKLLKRMADLGFGRLDTSSGKVLALKDVKVKLQSIGKAAIGTETTIEGWRARNKFRHLPAVKAAEAKQSESKPLPVASLVHQSHPAREGYRAGVVYIAVNLGEKLVSLPVPGNLTDAEVGMLVRRLRND